MKNKIILSIIGTALLVSCSKKLAPVEVEEVSEVVEVVSLNSNQLAGKAIYEAKCGKCHKLYNVSDYSKEQWPNILEQMQPKAKITDDQKAQVLDYIVASL